MDLSWEVDVEEEGVHMSTCFFFEKRMIGGIVERGPLDTELD